MRTRYCLLGNSHIAALKRGWDLVASEYPGLEVTMFAAGGDHFSDITVRDGILEPTTDELKDKLKNRSGGQDRIVLSDYDVFVVAGLGFDIVFLARFYETYPTFLHTRPERDLVSIDVLAEVLLEDLRDSLSYKLAKLVRASTSQPVYVCWVPFKRRKMLGMPKQEGIAAAFKKIIERSEEELIHAVMDRVAVILAREGLHVIKQPEDTLDGRIFTREELSKAATLPSNTPNQAALMDIGHMNPEFGRHMMRHVLAVTGASVREFA